MMQTLVNWLRKAWYRYQKPPQSALQLIHCEWVSEHDYTVAWCCDRCPYLEWIADGKRICRFPGEETDENQLACRPANRYLKEPK